MIKLLLALLLIPNILLAAPPTRTSNYTTQTTIRSADVAGNENVIFSYLQAGVDTFADGSIIGADISSSAAIAYSKLNLASSIVNSDISASAAISGSKLDLSSAGAITSSSTSTFAGNVGIGTTLVNAGRLVIMGGNVGINTTNTSGAALKVFGGNVGIGTLSPGVALDVNGTIRATAYAGIGFVPTAIEAFTSNGTWTKPANVTSVYVKAWGAGGGSAGHSVPGGGGGGYAEGIIAVTGNVTVTVGTGGTAGSVNTPGTNGGNTTFAGTTTLTANGGAVSTGAGGSASNGSINITGQNAESDPGSTTAGDGGDSAFGGRGGWNENAGAATRKHSDGQFPGGGGSAAGGSDNGASGGAGANGLVIVYY